LTSSRAAPLTANGWTLFAHPLFIAQVEALADEVERLRAREPDRYRDRRASKRLAALLRLALDIIPQDPGRAEFRQGHALGESHAHWRRARFFQQYRLFFRYHSASQTIVYAWVNDDTTLRAVESPDDAWRVFRAMLQRGQPPDDWEALLEEARATANRLPALAQREVE